MTKAEAQRRLDNRTDQLRRLAALGAPDIIMQNQCRMVHQAQRRAESPIIRAWSTSAGKLRWSFTAFRMRLGLS